MDKAAVAPEVAPGEQHDAYVLVVTISCSSSHPAQAKNKRRDDDRRRVYAPSGTHPATRNVDKLLNCSQKIAQLARYSVLRAGEGCASRPGQARSMGIFIH